MLLLGRVEPEGHRTSNTKRLLSESLCCGRCLSKYCRAALALRQHPKLEGHRGWRYMPFPQSRMPASIEEFNKAKCMEIHDHESAECSHATGSVSRTGGRPLPSPPPQQQPQPPLRAGLQRGQQGRRLRRRQPLRCRAGLPSLAALVSVAQPGPSQLLSH